MILSLGLIGYPLQQSLSPRLHGAGLHALGLSGEYRLYPVPPLPEGEAELRSCIARMRAGELDGLNVTIPHKQAVIPFLDELSERSRAIGAVNTIFRKGDRVVGENTDAPGFLQDLDRQMHSGDPGQRRMALVLGAGGAARAVVYALWQQGWQVGVAARNPAQAQMLVDSLNRREPPGPWMLTAFALEKAALQSLRPDLIVNASSAGMVPDLESSPWPAGLPFPKGAFVYDLVYKPVQTALLRAARSAGLRGVNGLGMLVEQAALALELWSGKEAPRQAMRDSIRFLMDDSGLEGEQV